MRARPAAATLTLAAILVAACGTSHPAAGRPAPWAPPAGAAFLATSLDTAAGSWAITVMGGSAASRNNFWQLFHRPAGSSQWKLVTPPGVADNGGLVVTGAGRQALITGFRPSQGLTYTPLSQTSNGGRAWAAAGPLGAALANTPDALAAAPATGRLLALTTSGTSEVAAPGYTRWHVLSRRPVLAATTAGRRCLLHRLTAAAFTPAGTPVLAGACARPGIAGIFARRKVTWQAAGPTLPGTGRIVVLRLTTTAAGLVALLQAGTGRAATLYAAWTSPDIARWTISPALRTGATPISASFGTSGMTAIILPGRRGEIIAASGQWHLLPALPGGTATLSPGSRGQIDALAVRRSILTVWRLAPGATTWAKAQVIKVPIQFGSSS
jgi:hypothetical protein